MPVSFKHQTEELVVPDEEYQMWEVKRYNNHDDGRDHDNGHDNGDDSGDGDYDAGDGGVGVGDDDDIGRSC